MGIGIVAKIDVAELDLAVAIDGQYRLVVGLDNTQQRRLGVSGGLVYGVGQYVEVHGPAQFDISRHRQRNLGIELVGVPDPALSGGHRE